MVLCVAEFLARHGRLALRYVMQMGARYAAVVVLAWITAIALWPWLQIGNPWQQFKVALMHFATIPMSYEFSYWGERIWTDGLPRSYIPGQLLARLPEAFLFLLAVAFVYCNFRPGGSRAAKRRQHGAHDRSAGLRTAALTVARAARLPHRMRGRYPPACIPHRSARDHL